jgi:periplasmic protein CpxP/Spy
MLKILNVSETIMMKKLSFLLPGAVALMIAGAPMLAVHAQNPGQMRPRQEMRQKLNLTEQQKQQIQAIQKEVQDDIANTVLSAEQRSQYQAAIARGERPRQVMRSLNLSDQQKTEIRNRMRASKERIQRDVLTQAQRDQMQQFRQNRQNRRGMNRQSM